MTRVVAIANDHAGLALKNALLPVIAQHGFELRNLGTDSEDSVDYPDYGRKLGETIASGAAQLGIAICGSGIGISIAANRIPGVRAALCYTPEAAALARKHNDANILALGARLTETNVARQVLETFLTTEFEGGRHTARVKKLG